MVIQSCDADRASCEAVSGLSPSRRRPGSEKTARAGQ